MGLCHSQGFKKRSSSVNSRTKVGSVDLFDKNSSVTNINEKRGKTASNNIKTIKGKDNLSEFEYEINKRNDISQIDILSQIDKISNYSEKIKYDLINEDKNNNKKKSKNIETFFNKVVKQNSIISNNKNNDVKQKPIVNIKTKFNNFSKDVFISNFLFKAIAAKFPSIIILKGESNLKMYL